MTLMNGMISERAAHLWTDTGIWCGETGKLLGHDIKAFWLHTWPAAWVMACQGGNFHQIAASIGNAWPATVAELLAETEQALRDYARTGGVGRILVATNADRPRLFMVASDHFHPDAAPFEHAEVGHFVSSGAQSQHYADAIAKGFTLPRMERLIADQGGDAVAGVGPLARLGSRVWMAGQIAHLTVGPKRVSFASRLLSSRGRSRKARPIQAVEPA